MPNNRSRASSNSTGRTLNQSQGQGQGQGQSQGQTTSGTALRPSGHHPAFLIYPFLYILSAGPLAFSTLTPIANSVPFSAFTGSMLAAAGLLDSLLWSSIVLFSRSEDLVATGLDQFIWLRTPEDRSFGNMIWVQGNVYRENERSRVSRGSRNGHGWWGLTSADRNTSQLSLRHDQGPPGGLGGEHGIQMDIVTTVVVEDERELNKKDSTIGSLDL
jgi:hypothetical protein